MVTFYALIQPCIRRLSGLRDYLNTKIKITLSEAYPKSSPRTRLLVGALDYSGGAAKLHVTERGKGTISALNGINAIAIAQRSANPLESGAELEAYLI
jgi:molybdopterin molybdotransferase